MMNIRTLALLAMATTTLAVTELPAQEQHRSPTLEEYTLGSHKARAIDVHIVATEPAKRAE